MPIYIVAGSKVTLFAFFALSISLIFAHLGMMPNILRIFEAESKKLFIDWNDILKGWKKEGRWHVEVY